MTVDAVLFDLDGTLVEYEQSAAEVLDAAFSATGVDPFFDVGEYGRRFESFLDGSADARTLRRRCFAAIAEERGRDPDAARRVADAYSDRRDPSTVRRIPGARAALDALADDHRIGIVTNGPPDIQAPKLDAAGLDGIPDAVVFAGFDAPAKPDPAPFHRALDALGTTPERSVHVGNSLSSDVAGARAAGCGSVWVPATDDDPDPAPDVACRDIAAVGERPWRA